ncbi:unnamed protein product [Arctogadus glacialis]
MQFFREAFCRPCSARVTSPQEDMEYRMGNCIGIARNQLSVAQPPRPPGPPPAGLYGGTGVAVADGPPCCSALLLSPTASPRERLLGSGYSRDPDAQPPAMGNENSTEEAPQPEDGDEESVFLFPPQEYHYDIPKTGSRESLTQTTALGEGPGRAEQNTEASTLSLLPDIPVVCGLPEESRTGFGGYKEPEEDHEDELEFPHDLLPSLDFSSDLNIWESSLGRNKISLAEKKGDQVNSLLAGPEQCKEIIPLVALDSRPPDGGPGLPGVHTYPQTAAVPSPSVPPRSHLPPSEDRLDRELREAFQECEEQMASLGAFDPPSECPNSSGSQAPAPEDRAGQAEVNGADDSSARAPIVAHPGHSGGDHGNSGSTHGNSEGADCQKGTLVFGFRDYILGTDDGAGKALGESQQGEQNPGARPCELLLESSKEEAEITAQRNTRHPMQSEASSDLDYVNRSSVAPMLSEHGEGEVKHKIGDGIDCKKASRKKSCKKAMLVGSFIKNKLQRDIHSEEDSDINMNVTEQEMEKNPDRVTEVIPHSSPGPCLQERCNTAAIDSETHKQADLQTDEEQGINKKVKKREKKGHRKKKQADKRAEIAKASQSECRPQSNTDATESPPWVTPAGLNVGPGPDSLVNAESLLQVDGHAALCAEQPDNGLNYKKQLSALEPASLSPPPATPGIGLSGSLLCPPRCTQTHSDGTQQADHHPHTDDPPDGAPYTTPTSERELTGSIQVVHHMLKEIQHWNSVNPSTPLGTDSETSTVDSREDVCASQEERRTEGGNSPLTRQPAPTSVGDGGREPALLDASAIANGLPLTTPTAAEFREGEGEGEKSEESDSPESAAAVAVTVSPAAGGEGGSGGTESDAGEEREDGDLDRLVLLSLIGTQEKCSLAFSFEETFAEDPGWASVDGDNTTPHNSEDEVAKDLSDDDDDFERVTVRSGAESQALKQPPGAGDCIESSLQKHSAVESGRAAEGEGGGGRVGGRVGGGGGGGGEVAERGGIVREHRSASQPERSACGVSSAETERRPPPEAAESQAESQQRRGQPVAAAAATVESPSVTQRGGRPEPEPELVQSRETVPLCDTEADTQDGRKPNPVAAEKAFTPGPVRQDASSARRTEEIDDNGTGQCSAFLPLNTVRDSPSEGTEGQPVHTGNSTADPFIATSTADSGAAQPGELVHSQGTAGGTMSGATGVARSDHSGGNRRVHFNDSVKPGGPCSVGLRSTAPLDLGCASLPPLTVHESLRHPVVETSYSFFQEVLSLQKQDIPADMAPKGDESAKRTPTERPEPREDVKAAGAEDQINTVEEKQGKAQLLNNDNKADTTEVRVKSGRHEVCVENNGQLPRHVVEMKQGRVEDGPDPSIPAQRTEGPLGILSSSIPQATPNVEVSDCSPPAVPIKDAPAINTSDGPGKLKTDVKNDEKNVENLGKKGNQGMENDNSKISVNVMDTNDLVNDTKDAPKCISEHEDPATAALDNSPDVLIKSPTREMDKQKQPTHSPCAIRPAAESDDAIAQTQFGTESGLKSPIHIETSSCDASIIDGLMHASPALRVISVLNQDNMKGMDKNHNSPFDVAETQPDEKQEDTKESCREGTADSPPQQDNGSDRAAGGEVGNLPSIKPKAGDTEPSKESSDGISGIEIEAGTPTPAHNDLTAAHDTLTSEGMLSGDDYQSVWVNDLQQKPTAATAEQEPQELIEEGRDSAGTLYESAGSGVLTAEDHSVRAEDLEVSGNGLDIPTVHTTNQSKDICAGKADILSSEFPEQPKTLEKTPSAAATVEIKGSGLQQSDIQGAVCEPHELQSSNESAVSQSRTVAQTPIKGPDTTQPDKASLDEKKKASQGSDNNKMDAINNEPEEKQRPVKATGAADVVGSGSVRRSDMPGSAVTDRVETSALHRVSGPGSGAHVRMPEADDSISAGDQVIDHSGDASPSVLAASKCPEDLVEIDAAADTASSSDRVPGDKGSVMPPHTDPIEDASPPLIESKTQREHAEASLGSGLGPDLPAADLEGEASAAIYATVQVCASAAPVPESQTKMSQSPDQGITGTRQEPGTDWIQGLRDAARNCELENEGQASDLQTILRPLPSLESPQLDFLTPTADTSVPLSLPDSTLTAAAEEHHTAITAPLEYVQKPGEVLNWTVEPVLLQEAVTKAEKLPEPVRLPEVLPEPVKLPEVLPEPVKLPESFQRQLRSRYTFLNQKSYRSNFLNQ